MTRDNIISSILTKLDELTPFNEGLVISTGNDLLNPIKAYINDFLPVCSDKILRDAAYHHLPLTVIPAAGIKGNMDNIVTIELPADFIRIGMVKFTSWQKPITENITVEHPLYLLQLNKYTRGGNAKPVVVLKQDAGKKQFECYTVKEGEESNPHLTYVAKKQPEELPDVLIPAFSWLVASEVFKVIEKKELAEQAFISYTSTLINT